MSNADRAGQRQAAQRSTSAWYSLQDVRRGAEHGYRVATSHARTLPSFLIIGAQKCGTNSLFEYLAEHPALARPELREVQYFTHNFYRPLSWYRARFPRTAVPKATFESTPYYLFHPACPGRIRLMLPRVKLIVLLRDPAERAYSHHNHETVMGFEHLDFATALAQEEQRLAGEEERLLADPRYRSVAHQHHSYVARGMYARQLESWYDAFPREQILVLAAEDLFAQPETTLHRVQTWLGLEEHTPSKFERHNARSYSSLDPGMEAELRGRFAADTARLRQLTGRDFPWRPGEPDTSSTM